MPSDERPTQALAAAARASVKCDGIVECLESRRALRAAAALRRRLLVGFAKRSARQITSAWLALDELLCSSPPPA